MATHATVWYGLMSLAASSLAVGTAVVKAGDEYLPATTANRTTYGRAVGIAKTEADASNRTFEYQVAGVLTSSLSGVGTGTAGDYVIVAADGSLTRTASPGGSDDIIGTCPGTSGDVVVQPCASPGGGAATVADDIAKQGGSDINRVKGLNRVPFLTNTGTAAADGAKPPIGGGPVRNQAFGVDGYRLKRPTPHGYFDPFDYGAIADGDTHPLSGYFANLAAAQAVFPHATSLTNELDWAAVQAAINAAVDAQNEVGGPTNVQGGQVHIGRGIFRCDQPLVCKQTVGVGLVGASGGSLAGSFNNSASVLIYTGTGTRFIDARSSRGFRMRDLSVKYSSTSFLGMLVDLSHSTATDTSGAEIHHCSLYGGHTVAIGSGQGCHALLYMKGAIDCTIDRCLFAVAHRGIKFSDDFGNYSNSHNVTNCQFIYLNKAICNGIQSIHVRGCTFEGSGGVMTAAYQDDYPTSRADATDTFTFSASGATITRAGPGSFITDGWRVGMQPILLGTSNPAYNGMPSYVSRVTANTISFDQVTLTFTGNTITRSFGSFIEDGWTIGMIPNVFGGPGGSVVNGNQTAITNVTANTLTLTGMAYGGETSNSALISYASEHEYDAYTYGTPGWTWPSPGAVGTDNVLILKGGAGPLSFSRCWFGDQFLSTAWIKLGTANGFALRDCFISGNDHVLDVQFETKGVTIDSNYLQCPSTPFQLSTEANPSNGSIDGLVIKGNSGNAAEVTWPDAIITGGAAVKNIVYQANVDTAEALDTAVDVTIERFDRYVHVTASGKTVTLPAKPYDGELHTVKASGAFTTTVGGNGHNIDGAATAVTSTRGVITVRYKQATTTWEIVGATSAGSFTAPTGTGVVTVTGGVLDAASTGTTGTGNFARATSPTFVTPTLGAATGTSFDASSYVSAGGGTVAQSGPFRVANNSHGFAFRRADNLDDIYPFGLSGTNDLYVGAGNAGAKKCTTMYLYPTNGGQLLTNAAGVIAEWTGSAFAFAKPRLGYSSNPYASDGRASQAMADANQTAASSVYSRREIKCTGALTANRTLTLPHPASEDASYRKTIENATTGGFSIVVSTGTGTTYTLALGTKEVSITPDGVKVVE